jgi:hypothetical protein
MFEPDSPDRVIKTHVRGVIAGELGRVRSCRGSDLPAVVELAGAEIRLLALALPGWVDEPGALAAVVARASARGLDDGEIRSRLEVGQQAAGRWEPPPLPRSVAAAATLGRALPTDGKESPPTPRQHPHMVSPLVGRGLRLSA